MDSSKESSRISTFSIQLKIERENSLRSCPTSRFQFFLTMAGPALGLLGIVATVVIGLGWLP